VFFTGKHAPIRGLLDSGASTSLMSPATLAEIRKFGAEVVEIFDHDISISNASGDSMPINGVYRIHCSFGHSATRVNAPFVVPAALDGQLLVGTNVLASKHIGIELKPDQYTAAPQHRQQPIAAVEQDRVPPLHPFVPM
jgi:hypothetical protein